MTVATASLAGEWPMDERQVVELEERSWLPRHCRGDDTAFPALMSAYRGPVYGYLVRCGIAEADRDDLFQSSFLKIHAAAASYEPARALAPWVFTIVANTVRNHFRGDRNPPGRGIDKDPPDPVDPSPNPERVAAARETVAWIEQAIAALPLAQREVLILSTIVGMPQSEVAEALRLPLNTVKTLLRRARLTLTGALARREAPARLEGGSDE
jgi:RNA polymerase sigma factor (sigma-70 family)